MPKNLIKFRLRFLLLFWRWLIVSALETNLTRPSCAWLAITHGRVHQGGLEPPDCGWIDGVAPRDVGLRLTGSKALQRFLGSGLF